MKLIVQLSLPLSTCTSTADSWKSDLFSVIEENYAKATRDNTVTDKIEGLRIWKRVYETFPPTDYCSKIRSLAAIRSEIDTVHSAAKQDIDTEIEVFSNFLLENDKTQCRNMLGDRALVQNFIFDKTLF
jgi:hypothetical protein